MRLEEKLTHLRKREGLTQQKLADALNVSRQAISKWEVGTAVPSTDNLIHLGRLFGVAVDVLVNEQLDLDGKPDAEAPEEAPAEVPEGPAEPEEPAVAEAKRPVAPSIWKLIVIAVCALLLFTVLGMSLLSDRSEKRNARSSDSLESEIVDMSSGEYITIHP